MPRLDGQDEADPAGRQVDDRQREDREQSGEAGAEIGHEPAGTEGKGLRYNSAAKPRGTMRRSTGDSARHAPMRIWIDTDIGSDVDDALALAYALRHPAFELAGVSTVPLGGPVWRLAPASSKVSP